MLRELWSQREKVGIEQQGVVPAISKRIKVIKSLESFVADNLDALVKPVRSFATMMKRKIVMPAVLMGDTKDEGLFAKFSRVAQQTGVYTARDYADIVEHLVEHWAVASLRGLSDQAARAQNNLCSLRTAIERLLIALYLPEG